MTDRRWLTLTGAVLGGVVALLFACEGNFFLRGTVGGDCDMPRTITSDLGVDPGMLRRSNCQASGAVCCRRSAQATRTTCQFPEDCYVAAYQGACATPVDCSNTQTCGSNGKCQCVGTQLPCEDPSTHVFACCSAGSTCMNGMCQPPSDIDGGVL